MALQENKLTPIGSNELPIIGADYININTNKPFRVIEYHNKVLYVIHGKIDVTVGLAVSAVHSNKDMETPRRGIKQVHTHSLRGICNSHN